MSKKDDLQKKAIVIGIDGGTFDLIKPWAEQGFLPNFKKLIEEGVQGELESTIPPITGPAWTSFQTGKNPGKHGVFDWLMRDEKSYRLKPVNSKTIGNETLWEIISKQDKKVCVVNVPVTYPPKKVNGFMVTGMLTPSKESEFTYPSDLKKELEEKFSDYEINPKQQYEPLKTKKWIKGLKGMIKKRKDLAVYLIKEKEWDFFMVHFVASDLIQHRMWHTLSDSENPILEIYKEIDKAIGEIIDSLPREISLFLMSDHGFGPLYYNTYLNNWLLRDGYLCLKNDFFTLVKKIMYKLGITPVNVYTLMGKIGVLSKGLKLGKGQRYSLVSKFFLSAQNIDWKRTKAYSHGNIGQIYINTEGREPQGCVGKEERESLVCEIIEKLKKAKHSKTRENLFDKIFRKEEIYSGKKTEIAPDILILPKRMENMAVGVSEFISNKIVEPTFDFTGGHRMNGILIAKGENFKKGAEIKGARIIDLAPTILYFMGLSVPNDMDGKPLKDIFREDFLKFNQAEYIKRSESKENKQEVFDQDEEAAIKKRLKDLGYIS